MTISEYEIFDVSTSEPDRCCEFCGQSARRLLDVKWCSPRCKFHGEKISATVPSPDEIRKRAARIRSTWSNREHLVRAGIDPSAAKQWDPPMFFVPAGLDIEDG